MIQGGKGQAKVEVTEELISYFPKKPYPIQLSIAQMLYNSLEEGKIKLSIIESPTGTGKTYSLLVPLIVWLKNNKNKMSVIQTGEEKVKLPSWLKKPSEYKVEKLLSEKKKKIEQCIEIEQAQKQLKRIRSSYANLPSSQRGEDQQIEMLSDQQDHIANNKKKFHQKINAVVEKQLKVEDQSILPKIIFVSRTHSQLMQVIESIKLVVSPQDDLKYVEIGSKQHLCINPLINSNKSNIGEKCQYILDHSKCNYFHNLSIRQFYNNSIEQANRIGSDHNLCPYYATRNLIDSCDILCLPYPSILNSQIRNRIGVNIHNSIIVFDEGHNLIDQEKQLHSPEMTTNHIAILAQQVDQYTKQYGEKMKISNYKLLLHFLDILRAFTAAIHKMKEVSKSKDQDKKYMQMKYLDFVIELGVKEMKIFKIVKYIQLNNLDQKLAYFNTKEVKLKDRKEESKISVSNINGILTFLVEFNRFNEENQILLLKWEDLKQQSIKILCLESEQLQKIVSKSRLTIIAGGTMQPLDDLHCLLESFKGRVFVNKYNHIIDKQQCRVLIVKRYGNEQVIFNHQTLNRQSSIKSLKVVCLKAIESIIKKTQKGGGIVIFIQNYRLINFFKDIFKNSSFYSRMLFDGKQPQEKGKGVFEDYKQKVENDTENNYFLFSVMGGKLSEGINFTDRLARSLVVFGLPYANIYAAEVAETINYNEKMNKSTKKEYLQSLCARTLNQTIGRGIRHIKDYVKIYLIDSRFQGMREKLSEWMRDRIYIVNDLQSL